MYGYIYKTVNTKNNKFYIGKHEVDHYDPAYLGSGKLLQKAIKKYGVEAFTNEIISIANSPEELNQQERELIAQYKTEFGKTCYNLAEGGTGGNVYRYADNEVKDAFRAKMTAINKERCSSEKFKKRISEVTHERYKDPAERKRTGDKIKQSLSHPEWSRAQSARLQEIWASGKKRGEQQGYKCALELNDTYIEFETLGQLLKYLKDTYGFNPSGGLDKIIECTKQGKTYVPFHKNKWGHLTGLKIYLYSTRRKCRD